MGFNLGGFGDMVKQLKGGGIGEMLQKLPLDKLPLDQLIQKLPLDKILSSSFVEKFTPYVNIQDLLQKGGFYVSSAEDIQALPQDKLNEHVNNTTSFGSFKELLLKAVEYYTQSHK